MSEWSWPSWDDWLNGLDSETRSQAENLRDQFSQRGVGDPEGWARSEISEDVAQMTRFLFLTAVWRRMKGAVSDALVSESATSLLEAGCDRGTMETLVKSAVYQLAFELCYLLDEPDGTTWTEDGVRRSDVEPTDRRWQLREVRPDGSLSFRDVSGLHESLLETDPSGTEGSGWLGFA
jgi:hypothetical protein